MNIPSNLKTKIASLANKYVNIDRYRNQIPLNVTDKSCHFVDGSMEIAAEIYSNPLKYGLVPIAEVEKLANCLKNYEDIEVQKHIPTHYGEQYRTIFTYPNREALSDWKAFKEASNAK